MNKKNRIILPDGTTMKREYERALVMEVGYQARYKEMLLNDTREGLVLVYIISKMDSNNELICDIDTIAKDLKYSRVSVARAIKLLKEKYSDLVTVGKFHGINKFIVDKERCIKA